MRIVWLGIILVTLTLSVAHGQESSSAICVLAFEDANENGLRDTGELPLPGVAVNIAINTDVIVASHVTTDQNDHFCFEGLASGVYNLYFVDSPNHRATTQNSAALALGAERIKVDFGAVPLSPFADEPTATTTAVDTTDELALSTRLLIAALGTVLVMIFMLGLGVMIASAWFY
jgi:hypothetical protein